MIKQDITCAVCSRSVARVDPGGGWSVEKIVEHHGWKKTDDKWTCPNCLSIKCSSCGLEQPGTRVDVERLGWNRTDAGWQCPFCGDHIKRMSAVLAGGPVPGWFGDKRFTVPMLRMMTWALETAEKDGPDAIVDAIIQRIRKVPEANSKMIEKIMEVAGEYADKIGLPGSEE